MSDEKNEEEKELTNSDYEALSSLLDFYSDRAVAHASFLVACVFGLFTILSLLGGKELHLKFVYSIAYWMLWLGGFYSLLNFRLFATEAQKIAGFIENGKISLLNRLNEKKETKRRPNRISVFINKRFRWFKELKHKFTVITVSYFLLIGLFPYVFTIL